MWVASTLASVPAKYNILYSVLQLVDNTHAILNRINYTKSYTQGFMALTLASQNEHAQCRTGATQDNHRPILCLSAI